MLKNYSEMQQVLGEPGASDKAAAVIYRIIKKQYKIVVDKN